MSFSLPLYILFLWEFPSFGFLTPLSVCLWLCLSPILSLSCPPPLFLPWRHLRSISAFSPPSMWLQPFSHPTSNQTYSAYWWSSKGPQVDVYLSLHEAPSASFQSNTPPNPYTLREAPVWVLNTQHWLWHVCFQPSECQVSSLRFFNCMTTPTAVRPEQILSFPLCSLFIVSAISVVLYITLQ